MKVYVDEALIDTQTLNVNRGSRTGSAAIGRRSDSSANFFDGKVDEFYAWQRALSAAEINDLFNEGSP